MQNGLALRLTEAETRAETALALCRAASEAVPPALTEELDLKAKFVFQPIRVAICGNMVSPPLFESVELLPREDILARIDHTLELVYGA